MKRIKPAIRRERKIEQMNFANPASEALSDTVGVALGPRWLGLEFRHGWMKERVWWVF